MVCRWMKKKVCQFRCLFNEVICCLLLGIHADCVPDFLFVDNSDIFCLKWEKIQFKTRLYVNIDMNIYDLRMYSRLTVICPTMQLTLPCSPVLVYEHKTNRSSICLYFRYFYTQFSVNYGQKRSSFL